MAAVAQRSVNLVERANYNHFLWDVVWYGIALSATNRFMQYYGLKMGADAVALGLMVALPQLILMISTVLSPWWRNRYPNCTRAVVWPAVAQRFIFLLPAFTPFFPETARVPWLILSVCLPSIGQGVASTIFLMMMRETITPERLSPLFNQRMFAVNVGVMAGALGFGYLLVHVPFPLNYSLMFLGAFAFGLMSLWHVLHVKQLDQDTVRKSTLEMKKVKAMPSRPLWVALRDPRLLSVLLAVVLAHFAQTFISAPQPMHLAHLGAKEDFLALFGMVEVAASGLVTILLTRWLAQWGAFKVLLAAMVAISLGAFLMAFAPVLWVTLIACVLTGAGWTCAFVALLDFYAQRTDRNDVQATNLWHQLLFLAAFVGPMLGSLVVKTGMSPFHAMILGGVLRLVCGLLIWVGVAWLDRKAQPMNTAS